MKRTIEGWSCAVAACVALLCATGAGAQAVDPAATRQLRALFDASWEASMRRYPEWATFVGDNRYGDQLFDASREGEVADYARARRELAEAKAITRERLGPADQVSLSAPSTSGSGASAPAGASAERLAPRERKPTTRPGLARRRLSIARLQPINACDAARPCLAAVRPCERCRASRAC